MNTGVGGQAKVIKVQECSPQVLATTLDFIYGISLPEDLSTADAQSLLIMADLYLMEDLKVALAPLLGKRLNEGNVLEISVMAERHSLRTCLTSAPTSSSTTKPT